MKTWLFDLDDTLIPNHHDYSFAQIDLIQLIADRFGRRHDRLLAQTEIDFIELVIGSLGYRAPNAVTTSKTLATIRERYPDETTLGVAMREAYVAIATGIHGTPEPALVETANAIGSQMILADEPTITPNDVLTTQERIDMGNHKTYGWRMERFPTSTRETYAEIANRFGVQPTEKELELAYGIGLRAFDETRYKERGLLPGAADTLTFLTDKGDELILVTKGDPRVQERKLCAVGIDRWFHPDLVRIIEDKNPEILTSIVGPRDPANVTHVGNSIRSDVNIAKEAGLGVVYIPCETWAYERQHNGFEPGPRAVKLDRIDEMIARYDELP